MGKIVEVRFFFLSGICRVMAEIKAKKSKLDKD